MGLINNKTELFIPKSVLNQRASILSAFALSFY